MSRKRSRSPDPPIFLQSKMHVNEKLVDSRNADKMKIIYDKTVGMLFKGAKGCAIPKVREKDLTKLLVLNGNGKINLLQHGKLSDLSKRKLSKCCERDSYIDSVCVNCNVPMCEYCGFSCANCGNFLCNACIVLFGCGTTDFPECHKCVVYE